MFEQPKGKKISRKAKTKNNIIYSIVVVILTIIALVSGKIHTVQLTQTSDAPFQVAVIDVGQGDSILVEADGHFMLIDAGDNGGGEKAAAYLDERHVTALDYVVATHLHADHIGGMPAVLEGRTVQKIIEPPCPEKFLPTSKTYERYLDAVEASGAAYSTAEAGDHFTLGGAQIEVLCPGENEMTELNNTSLVLRVTYEDFTCLFTGDMEESEEKWLLSCGTDVSADFLKVAHHGSSYSSSKAFLEAVRPKYAAISCGKDNKYGHPSAGTVERLKNSPNAPEVHITAEEGTIQILYTHSPEPVTVSVQYPKENT